MSSPFQVIAGQPVEFYEPGDFFRILAAQAPIDVRFYRQGVEVGKVLGVSDGYAERWRGQGFDRYVISSNTTQTVHIVTRNGADVFYDKAPVGDVQVTNIVPVRDEYHRPILTLIPRTSGALTQDSARCLVADDSRIYAAIASSSDAELWITPASAGVAQAALPPFPVFRLAPFGTIEFDHRLARHAFWARWVSPITSSTVTVIEGWG